MVVTAPDDAAPRRSGISSATRSLPALVRRPWVWPLGIGAVLVLIGIANGVLAWNPPQAGIFARQWFSPIVSVPPSAVDAVFAGSVLVVFGVLLFVIELCTRRVSTVWVALHLVVLAGLVAGFALFAVAQNAARAGDARFATTYAEAAAADAAIASQAPVTPVGAASSVAAFRARLAPEALQAFRIDFADDHEPLRFTHVRVTGSSSGAVGPWIEQTVSLLTVRSSSESGTTYRCLIDPFTGRIEAIWWFGS